MVQFSSEWICWVGDIVGGVDLGSKLRDLAVLGTTHLFHAHRDTGLSVQYRVGSLCTFSIPHMHDDESESFAIYDLCTTLPFREQFDHKPLSCCSIRCAWNSCRVQPYVFALARMRSKD